ncbi:MAG TPA: LLM class flavin-dependent oxidoreductase [Thermoanaerobaculia bacterium]|nr:LLM class flavin-dependent oxidoreductase [Thermoanaerobaculia bacterium]
MELSLLLTSADDGPLLFEVARQADRRGLAALWLPEPSAVIAAALAVVTQRIGLRSSGLALPLHNPVRVAEEWSLVDNLSGGRAGVAFSPGEDPGLETVRRLWRGEALQTPDGEGRPIQVRILPQPVQPELPEWVATGSTFTRAGQVTRIVDSIEAALREGDGAANVAHIACRVSLSDALAAIEVLHGG